MECSNQRTAVSEADSATQPPALRVRREPLALVVTALVYAGAVGAALLTGQEVGGFNRGVEAVAATSGTILDRLAAVLPLGYAFGAGLVAAANPCGIALLPAYLGLYLGSGDEAGTTRPGSARLSTALQVSLAVTTGFVVLFGLSGLALGAATSALIRVFPWAGLAVGVGLVALGGRLLAGAELYTRLGDRVAGRLRGRVGRASVGGYFAYGLAYGLASLSCTLPIFLTVVGSAFATGGFISASAQLVLYALGMGSVITLLTLATAFFKGATIARIRGLTGYVQPVSVVLLLLASGYIIYYWLTLGGLLGRAGLV